jgi:hypothetical protein
MLDLLSFAIRPAVTGAREIGIMPISFATLSMMGISLSSPVNITYLAAFKLVTTSSLALPARSDSRAVAVARVMATPMPLVVVDIVDITREPKVII